MGQPVVHFEITGPDPGGLRSYYGDLFGWEFDTSHDTAPEVSDSGEYGFVDRYSLEDGTGIRGGVGGGPGFDSKIVFYINVDDVGAALEQAERLGGTRVLGPVTSPTGLVVAQFTDPAGNLVGLAGAT